MENSVEIWTDGSCPMNRGSNPGGWASILVIPESRWETIEENLSINYNKEDKKTYKCLEISGNDDTTTSNRMELTAVIEGIKKALELGFEEILVFSDSEYTVKSAMVWSLKWAKHKWHKKIKNKDLMKELYTLCSENNVKVEWVKARDGKFFNERADELAREEAAKLTEEPEEENEWTKIDMNNTFI